ncbi:MAG: Flagellar biosynthetic protein FliQ [Chlamydiae bacterium]|nr:Flagellar biosynthetic protein FliQ [Chlamydiota bacterium]
MLQSEIIQFSYNALLMILIVSGPPIILSMILGLMVAIFQAATQIQEQTLSFVVKLFAVIGTLMILGPWIGGQIFSYANSIFTNFATWSRQ